MSEVVWAAVGAGLTALLTKLVGKFIDRDNETITHGKSLRDELRGDIERLEGRIKELDDKVVHLETEVETWKGKVDEWRNKYYSLYEDHQLLKIAATAKDQMIEVLKAELAKFERRVFFVPSDTKEGQ